MKKLTARRDQKKPSLLVPMILEMGWFLQTLNLCLKDKRVHFSNSTVFLFSFKSTILSKLYCRIGIEERFYKWLRYDIVFAYFLAVPKSSLIAYKSWNLLLKIKGQSTANISFQEGAQWLTCNSNWQPVAWQSNRKCGAVSSKFLEGNITPVLNLHTAQGLFTSLPTWIKTKWSKPRVFGTSASLPVTTGFLQCFARKTALENGTRDARLNKD